MSTQIIELPGSSASRIEVLTDGDTFVGLGKAWIGHTLVRSGRLPLRPYTQTFKGLELDTLTLLGIDRSAREVRVKLKAAFRPLPVRIMRDHSSDPTPALGDCAPSPPVANGHRPTARLDIVLRPAKDAFNGVKFAGFDYRYEYSGKDVPLYYIYDQA